MRWPSLKGEGFGQASALFTMGLPFYGPGFKSETERKLSGDDMVMADGGAVVTEDQSFRAVVPISCQGPWCR